MSQPLIGSFDSAGLVGMVGLVGLAGVAAMLAAVNGYSKAYSP